MASLSVVAAQEAFQCSCALVVVGPAAAVGPFGEQGSVEPFGFAVGLWPVGLGFLTLILRPLQVSVQSLLR